MGKAIPVLAAIVLLAWPAALRAAPSDFCWPDCPEPLRIASIADLNAAYGKASSILGGDSFRLIRDTNAKKRRPIFRVISWNVQTFGSGVNPKREAAYGELLDHMFSTKRSAKILAIQELAQEGGAEKFSGLLPGGEERWNRSFQDTSDAQDNGFYTQRQVEVHWERFMFARQDDGGRWRPDTGRVRHPVRMAHMRVGDFDFTLINLHLTFSNGDVNETIAELHQVLDWLQAYFQDPVNDPDVIITGDFNLATRNGGANNRGAVEDVIESYPLFRHDFGPHGEWVPKPTELFVFVDEPTSRGNGRPANNYDHFIMSGDVYIEEYMDGSAGRMPADFMHTIEEAHGIYVSDHYPISAGFIHKYAGNDGRTIALDQPTWNYADSAPAGADDGIPSPPPPLQAKNVAAGR